MPALLLSGKAGGGAAAHGVLPLLSQWEVRERLPASREERGADVWTDVATCQQNRHLSSRLRDKGGWQGSLRSWRRPLCLRVFPGPTKAAAVSLRCHLWLHPLGLWLKASGCNPNKYSACHWRWDERRGSQPAVRTARRFIVPWRKDEAERAEIWPEGTGSWKEPMMTDDSTTAPSSGYSDLVL